MDERKTYEEKLNAQLKEWSAEIALLNAKADKATAETKIEYYKMITIVERKQETAAMKFQELRAAGDDGWEDLKAGAEKAWAAVKTALQSAASKFE